MGHKRCSGTYGHCYSCHHSLAVPEALPIHLGPTYGTAETSDKAEFEGRSHKGQSGDGLKRTVTCVHDSAMGYTNARPTVPSSSDLLWPTITSQISRLSVPPSHSRTGISSPFNPESIRLKHAIHLPQYLLRPLCCDVSIACSDPCVNPGVAEAWGDGTQTWRRKGFGSCLKGGLECGDSGRVSGWGFHVIGVPEGGLRDTEEGADVGSNDTWCTSYYKGFPVLVQL